MENFELFMKENKIKDDITPIRKIWNVPFREKQQVALSEEERSVLGTKSFHLQYDSFQIGNETNHFVNDVSIVPFTEI